MTALTRRDAIRFFSAAAIGSLFTRNLLAVPPIATANDPIGDFGFDKNAVQRTDLGDGITLLQGPGGNITQIAGSDGSSILIDCGVPGRGADVAAAATQTTGKIPATLVNTHWHFDHAGGNEALHKAGVVTIAAHENTLKRLSTTQKIEAFGMTFPASPEDALPTVTFVQSAGLRLPGGQSLSITHVPNAHTDGDIFLQTSRGDVIVCGDLFFNGTFPVIDASSNGSLDGMIAGADKLLSISNGKTRLIPGHGNLASKSDLQAFRDMLNTVRDRLGKFAAEGKSLDEVIAAKPLEDMNATWGSRVLHASHFERIVYPMLTKQG